MNNDIKFEMKECVARVSEKAGALLSVIDTMHNGLYGENMEQQVLDCLECVSICVSDIKNIADKCIEEVSRNS